MIYTAFDLQSIGTLKQGAQISLKRPRKYYGMAFEEKPYDIYRRSDIAPILSSAQQFTNTAHNNFWIEYLDRLIEYYWAATGFKDTELGVEMKPEVRHGTTEIYARVQA